MLKIAVQKSGRLYDDSLKLLKECGLHIDNGMDQLRAEVTNFPAEVYFLRNSDIPQYLEDGVVDIAILGQNVLTEQNARVYVLEKLGFSTPLGTNPISRNLFESSICLPSALNITKENQNYIQYLYFHLHLKRHHHFYLN